MYIGNVYRHTLQLVLRGEWPRLSPATKTHLSVTLQRCMSHLVDRQHPAAPKCNALISLVHNPWAHPALDRILNGQPDAEHEEGKQFSPTRCNLRELFTNILQVLQRSFIPFDYQNFAARRRVNCLL